MMSCMIHDTRSFTTRSIWGVGIHLGTFKCSLETSRENTNPIEGGGWAPCSKNQYIICVFVFQISSPLSPSRLEDLNLHFILFPGTPPFLGPQNQLDNHVKHVKHVKPLSFKPFCSLFANSSSRAQHPSLHESFCCRSNL